VPCPVGQSALPSWLILAVATASIMARSWSGTAIGVQALVGAGNYEKLVAYCDADVFVTYLLFLRFSLVTGALRPKDYGSSLVHLSKHIANRIEKRPHLQIYIDALEPMITSASLLERS
jgi:hypothetical protein